MPVLVMMVIACTYGDDGGYNATLHCIRAEVACCNCEATEPACWTHSLLVCLHLLVHTLYTTSGKVRPILHHSSQQYTAPQWSSKRLAAVTSGSWLLHTFNNHKGPQWLLTGRRAAAAPGAACSPSGCCSRPECDRPPAACRQRSGAAGPAGCLQTSAHVTHSRRITQGSI